MTINLGGKDRRLEFNQLAIEVFTKHTDYQTARADLYACIYAGLRGFDYAENPRQIVDYTFRDVIAWCDETNDEELVKAYNEFTDTNNFKKWYEKFNAILRTKLEEGEEKKKPGEDQEAEWFKIHKFALGRLGWSEYQYYTCSPYMFFAACEGYFDKLDDQAAMFRNLATVVNRSAGGKSDMNSVWPLHSDGKPEPLKQWTKEELDETIKKHKDIFSKIK